MVRLAVSLQAVASQAASIEAALRSLMRATRLEPGCLDCRTWVTVGIQAPDLVDVHYEERWVSEAAMEARVRSDAFTKVLEVLESATAAPHVDFDFDSRHLGLEYVEAVRHGIGRR